MKRALLSMALFLLAFGCRSAALTPADRFAELEGRLAAAPVDIGFDIDSTGAIRTSVSGTARVGERDVAIEVEGEMNGERTRAQYATDDAGRPADVKQAVIVGWTRMGLLHNLVRLLGDQEIDHASGGAGERVTVTNVDFDEKERKFAFNIFVEGRSVAAAELWLDERGRPDHRKQTTRFPGGLLHVEERYRWR